jgi:chromosome segregation ATPase
MDHIDLASLIAQAGVLGAAVTLVFRAGALVRDIAEIRRQLEMLGPQVATLREDIAVLRAEQEHTGTRIAELRGDLDDIREGAMIR